jgi:hypothetical protein
LQRATGSLPSLQYPKKKKSLRPITQGNDRRFLMALGCKFAARRLNRESGERNLGRRD